MNLALIFVKKTPSNLFSNVYVSLGITTQLKIGSVSYERKSLVFETETKFKFPEVQLRNIDGLLISIPVSNLHICMYACMW